MDQEKADKLKFTITSPGWQDEILPDLNKERATVMEILLRAPQERPEPKHSDEFLRGYVRGINYAASRPFAMVQEFERRLVDGLRRTVEDETEEQGVGSPYAPTEETP